MVDKNTLVNEVIVDRSPQAGDSMLEKTTNLRSESPGTQKCDTQVINEENCQTHKICFQNCDNVNLNMDSFNARGVRMENCGNRLGVPQVTISSSFFLFAYFCPHEMLYYQITGIVEMRRAMKTIHICSHVQFLLMVCG